MTDDQALERYAYGADTDAFAVLVGRYERLVFSVCVRRLGCTSDADDAAQQTFIKLARAATNIRGGVAAWLHTTATRTAIDLGRQKTTRRKHEAQAAQFRADRREALDEFALGDASGFDPVQQAAWRELSSQLDEVMLELPLAQRRLIVEVYFQGKTQREVAVASGKSQSRVCRQLHEAVAALRSALSKRGVLMSAGALATGMTVVQEAAAAPSLVLSMEFSKIGLTGLGSPSGLAWASGGSSAPASTATFGGGATSGGWRFGHPLVWALGAAAVLGLIIAAAAFFSGWPHVPASATSPPAHTTAVDAPAAQAP